MQDQTKPIMAFVLGFLIVILFPTMVFLVFIGMILIAIGMIDLAWITIRLPTPRKRPSKEHREETLQKIKQAVKKKK